MMQRLEETEEVDVEERISFRLIEDLQSGGINVSLHVKLYDGYDELSPCSIQYDVLCKVSDINKLREAGMVTIGQVLQSASR
jgi:hypothetical protein